MDEFEANGEVMSHASKFQVWQWFEFWKNLLNILWPIVKIKQTSLLYYFFMASSIAYREKGCPCNVVATVLNCKIVITEFKI